MPEWALGGALLLPDLSALVQPTDVGATVMTTLSLLCVAALIGESVVAFDTHRPRNRPRGGGSVKGSRWPLLVIELLGCAALVLHALTPLALDSSSLWYIAARWGRTAQLPLLRFAGRGAVLLARARVAVAAAAADAAAERAAAAPAHAEVHAPRCRPIEAR